MAAVEGVSIPVRNKADGWNRDYKVRMSVAQFRALLDYMWWFTTEESHYYRDWHEYKTLGSNGDD